MLPQCIAALTKAAGRQLTKAEISGIDERMHAAMKELARKDRAAFASMPRDVRLRKAAEIARNGYHQSVAEAQARSVRDMAVKVEQMRKLESFKPGLHGQLAALYQRLIGQNHFRGGDVSLETRADARFRIYAKDIDNRAQKGSYWGMMQNVPEQRNLFLSIFGHDTGDPEQAKFGQAVRDSMERARQDAVDVGIPIHPLDDYMPRNYAWEDVARDREQFVKDALSQIDPADYVHEDGTQMTPDELRHFVEAATDTLASNGSNKRGEDEPQKGGRGVGSKRNAPRQLHFKSPEAEWFMQEKYGAANNVMSLVQQHLRSIAHDIAVAETFGRNADEFVPQLIHKAFDNDNKAKLSDSERAALGRLKEHALRSYDAFRHPGGAGGVPLWAKASDTVRGVVANSLLGGQMFSSLVDNAMSTTYGLHVGATRSQLIANKLEGASLNPEKVAFVRRLGLVRDIMENGTDRFGAGELGNTAVRFMNHKMHVHSSMRWFDRTQVHGVSASLMDIWGENVARTPFSKLAPADVKYLQDRGITADHYRVWRMAELERGPDGNHHMLTADGIHSIPDEALRPIAEQRMSAVSEHFREQISKREAANARETEWVANRKQKLADLAAKAESTLEGMRAHAAVKGGHDQGVADARAEQLRAAVDRAQVEADISGYLSTENAGAKAHAFLQAVEDGAAVERQFINQRDHPDNKTDAVVSRLPKSPAIGDKMRALVQRYGSEIGSRAETLGKRQARAEARIAEAQKRVDAADKQRAERIGKKGQQFAHRVRDRVTELQDFAEKVRQRTRQRTDAIAMFDKQHGEELNREIRRLRGDSANRLMSMVLADTNVGARGASGNNLRDSIALHITPENAGTIAGQAWRWLLLLKQTPIGIFRTHMIDVPRGMEGWQARAKYRAMFVARGMAWGAATVALKSILLGNDPEDLASMKGLGKIAIASGGGGMYGDFLFGDTAEGAKHGYVHNALVKAAGPGAGMASDALDLFARSKAFAAGDGGNPMTYKAGLLKFMHSYAVPFGRLWYIKAAQNHLIYQQLMDELNPGYSARVRRRMIQNKEGSWWAPGTLAPQRAPDLSKAVGQ